MELKSVKILLIEDDKGTCATLKRHFEVKGARFFVEHRGDSGLKFLLKHRGSIDICILDINLPGMNGLDICHYARTQHFEKPILMLTCETSSTTVVNAFDIGANDYVRKPFDFFELEARIKSLLRDNRAKQQKILNAGNIKIDMNSRLAYVNDKELKLRRRDFDLLTFFVKNKEKVLTRDQIISSVWSFDETPYPNTVDAHISALRSLLKGEKKVKIETIFGIGYRLRG